MKQKNDSKKKSIQTIQTNMILFMKESYIKQEVIMIKLFDIFWDREKTI